MKDKYFIKVPRLFLSALFVTEPPKILTENIKEALFFDTSKEAEKFIKNAPIEEAEKQELFDNCRIVKYKENYVVGEDIADNMKVITKKWKKEEK